MDRIILRDILFFGYHGVLPEERLLGQEFRVTVELYLDPAHMEHRDRLEDTVNYAEVLEQVKSIILGKPCSLLETLAENIAAAILTNLRIKAVKITVGKPSPPLPFVNGGVEVTIKRRRRPGFPGKK